MRVYTLLNISIICKSKIDNKISNIFANTLLFIRQEGQRIKFYPH